jgi:hypothetical protein
MVKQEKALSLFKTVTSKNLDKTKHDPRAEVTKDQGTTWLVCWCEISDVGIGYDISDQSLTEQLLELDLGGWCAWVLRGCPIEDGDDEEGEGFSNRKTRRTKSCQRNK